MWGEKKSDWPLRHDKKYSTAFEDLLAQEVCVSDHHCGVSDWRGTFFFFYCVCLLVLQFFFAFDSCSCSPDFHPTPPQRDPLQRAAHGTAECHASGSFRDPQQECQCSLARGGLCLGGEDPPVRFPDCRGQITCLQGLRMWSVCFCLPF